MKKYNSAKDKKFKRLSYFNTNIYLDFFAYTFERNNETIVVIQDILYQHDFPSIFLPSKKKNWECASVAFATQNDINKVKDNNIEIFLSKKVETEYYFLTKKFISPEGSLLRQSKYFEKHNDYKIKHSYSKDKIKLFYNNWKSQKTRDGILFEDSEAFFFFCLSNLKKYNIQQVYIEKDGALAGFAWGVIAEKGWVGLHLKADNSYRGLSRFLHVERAKMFSKLKRFTIGTGAAEEGIVEYKKSLHPNEEIDLYHLLTGSKVNSL